MHVHKPKGYVNMTTLIIDTTTDTAVNGKSFSIKTTNKYQIIKIQSQ